MDLAKVKKRPLFLVDMYLHILIIYTKFYIIDCNGFCVIHHLDVFPYKSLRKQILHCVKRSKVNLGVII